MIATNSPVSTVRSTPRSARTGMPSDSKVLRSRRVRNTSPASLTAPILRPARDVLASETAVKAPQAN